MSTKLCKNCGKILKDNQKKYCSEKCRLEKGVPGEAVKGPIGGAIIVAIVAAGKKIAPKAKDLAIKNGSNIVEAGKKIIFKS